MRDYRRLLLVYGPQEEWAKPLYSSSWCVPLGLLSIGTYVKQQRPETEICLLDSAVLTYDEMRKLIDCNDQTLVGFSTTILNYRPSLKLAQYAKERGATVVFGGPQAGNLARNVLENRKFIDYAVTGYDEVPILKILSGEDPVHIPNIAYRDHRGEIVVKQQNNWVGWSNFPDRQLVQYLEKYKENWQRENSGKDFVATNVGFQRGCDWGMCNFCTEPRGTTNGSIEAYFGHLRTLRDTYGFSGFFDVSPGPAGRTIRSLLENRPRDLEDLHFRFYTYPHILTEEIIANLKDLNTWEVFIGVESGSIEILRRAAAVKVERSRSVDFSLEEYYSKLENSIRCLRKNGIDVKISFVLGLEGETEGTLEETQRYAKRLIDAGATSMACSILLPLPGTVIFRKILNHPTFAEKYRSEDDFDIEDIRKDFVDAFCQVPYEVIKNKQTEMSGLLPNVTAYGTEM